MKTLQQKINCICRVYFTHIRSHLLPDKRSATLNEVVTEQSLVTNPNLYCVYVIIDLMMHTRSFLNVTIFCDLLIFG